ncbi:MAG: phosphate acetyltransferase [Planctomycetes bacterium]|nr:phosphate acetyltransferase [Planctomycetota bacterium]
MTPPIVEELIRRAARRPAIVAYPEPQDARILQAAARAAAIGIARPVLVGAPGALPLDAGPAVERRPIQEDANLDRLAVEYARRRGVAVPTARRLVHRPLIHAATMVSLGEADCMVAGATHTTASVLQAAGLAIGYREGVSAPSSCFIIVAPRLGERRDVPLVFADCAVNVDPTAEELASIALSAAESARTLLGLTPRVAMLSFSTHGSAAHPKVDIVRRATELVGDSLTDGFVDGELQFDTAVDPAVAAVKTPGPGEVAGRANVLIFPDLNAGNITYKAVQRLSGALAVGPILQGFARPVNDLSRGASVDDVIATTAITVLQAQGNP